MNNQIDNLNYEFKFNMFLAKSNLNNIKKNEDRERSLRWMQKLSHCQRNLDEMQIRNEFLHYLVSNIQENNLRPPFTQEPPAGPLPPLARLLPSSGQQENPSHLNYAAKVQGAEPLIYQFSPDGGAFLTAQPVPRCGAFCYLTVVSQEKN